ncbi:MAG: hypothetical protein GY722_17235, partial [bacterium]|nr:hypothetical protein [bacterium]
EHFFDQDREAVDGFAHIDNFTTHEDFDVVIGAHHRRRVIADNSDVPTSAVNAVLDSSTAPFGK